MTESITQSAAKPLTITGERCYSWDEDFSGLPETLNLELTADEVAAVHAARAFLGRNLAIHSVNVSCTPPEIESWRCDVSYITVFRDVGCYLFLQGKYDCSEQVEYAVAI